VDALDPATSQVGSCNPAGVLDIAGHNLIGGLPITPDQAAHCFVETIQPDRQHWRAFHCSHKLPCHLGHIILGIACCVTQHFIGHAHGIIKFAHRLFRRGDDAIEA
jgi:hypothetical protein